MHGCIELLDGKDVPFASRVPCTRLLVLILTGALAQTVPCQGPHL